MATSSSVTQETLVGRVKWFNSSSGFGFITLTDSSLLGVDKGTDIFTHHSSIKVENEQYRYLVQGEYVELSLAPTTNGPHQFQAVDVRGIKGGKLMCETRREVKVDRSKYYETKQTVDQEQPSKKSITSKAQSQPKARGEGPREGGEWTYIVKSNRPNLEAIAQPSTSTSTSATSTTTPKTPRGRKPKQPQSENK